MKLAILETGAPPRPLAEEFGRYDAMFRDLIGPGFDYRTFDVRQGQFPVVGDGFDRLLITGSPAGAYDGDAWIAELEAFLRAAAARTRMVGVCFGHQVMATAFGGSVIKSPKGRAIGLHRYDLADALRIDGAASVAAAVHHQDQVVEAPASARVIGGNAFTPFGMLAYEFPAVSVQFHPEFGPAFAKALIERDRKDTPDAVVDAAIAQLDQPNDNDRIGAWIGEFLRE